MTISEMMNKLIGVLSEKRYNHSIGVMEEACKLAAHYQADVRKAEIAGLLHDCAKHIGEQDAFLMLRRYGEEPDEIQKASFQLLHGLLGYYIAKEQYGVNDEEILRAIYWHTTGKAGMNLLEKIIFVADYIEPGRVFDGLDEIRKTAYSDLDLCVQLCADSTIRYVLSKGRLLHPLTIETRNDMIMKRLIGSMPKNKLAE
jgi:predicted HD superfamily hydrolase involved in NAD metabolism